MLDGTLSKHERERLMQGVFDGFPELVEITLYRDGAEVESAQDAKSLEAASLTAADLAKERKAHPLPMKEILAGNVHVANSTLTAKLPAFTMALAQDTASGASPVVIAAVIRLEGLMRVGRSSGSRGDHGAGRSCSCTRTSAGCAARARGASARGRSDLEAPGRRDAHVQA
jgi:hypothetical protein